MSGTAGLSAARRRRGVVAETRPGSSQNNTIVKNEPPKPTTPMNLLKEHDKKLFDLEKKVTLAEETFITKQHLNSLNISSGSNLDNVAINKLETNSKELGQLRNEVTELKKNLQGLNSLVTTLRANFLSYDNERIKLQQLREEFDNFMQDMTTKLVEYNTPVNFNRIDNVDGSLEIDNLAIGNDSEGSELESSEVHPEELVTGLKKKRQAKAKAKGTVKLDVSDIPLNME